MTIKPNDTGLKATINRLRALLTRRDKIILLALLFGTIVFSILETLSISIIMPFITLATNPKMILQNEYSRAVYDFLSLENTTQFMVYFGVAMIAFYVFRSIYSISYTYCLNRFAFRKHHFFAYRLFSKAVEFNYQDFVQKKSNQIHNNIVRESYHSSQCMQYTLQMFSEGFTIFVLYILLLAVSLKLTIVSTLILGIQVFLITKILGVKTRTSGEIRAQMESKFNEIIYKTFGNFKIIKLKGNQSEVQKDFDDASRARANAETIYQTFFYSPKVILEFVGFVLLIACVLYILVVYDNVEKVLPIVSMYALALYRILPAVSRIMSSYTAVKYFASSVAAVYEDMLYHTEEEFSEPCEFESNIKLEKINFSYDEQNPILKDFDLEIKKGEKVAFCGPSGAGKSTLVDLIIGIYKPKSGKILVDGVEINNHNLRSWRKKIGYIPQNIYLFDGSVAENVAFGDEMDDERIKSALQKANILDFLENEHNGIYTRVGEGGVLLSGGQKQRIGIARAIYNDPEILVLDEATSALDAATESKIMDEIYDVAQNKTLLVIAHRLNTIERCERKIQLSRSVKGGGGQ